MLLLILHFVQAGGLSCFLSFYDALFCYLKLISLTFWWPKKSLDGDYSGQYIYWSKTLVYIHDMPGLTKKGIKRMDSLCKSDGNVQQFLDRPIIHQLLELCFHTIPSSVYALIVSALTFESSHQLLKAIVSKHNAAEFFLRAVKQTFRQYWIRRISNLWCLHSFSSIYISALVHAFSTKLLFGSDFNLLISLESNDSNMLQEWV